jgi:hypothetical protein
MIWILVPPRKVKDMDGFVQKNKVTNNEIQSMVWARKIFSSHLTIELQSAEM